MNVSFHGVTPCRKQGDTYRGTGARAHLQSLIWVVVSTSKSNSHGHSPTGAMRNLKMAPTFRMRSRCTIQERVALCCWDLVNKKNSTATRERVLILVMADSSECCSQSFPSLQWNVCLSGVGNPFCLASKGNEWQQYSVPEEESTHH